MSKTAAQQLGLLRRISPYVLPAQRAIIYKAMIWSKMEYASSAWIGATPTSLAQLDSIHNRAKRVIGLPKNEYTDHRIQLLSHRMPHAQGSWSSHPLLLYVLGGGSWVVMPADANIHVYDPRLRWSVRSPDPAVEVPRSNLSAMQDHFYHLRPNYRILFLWQIPSIRSRPSFSREVNDFIAFWLLLHQQLLNDFLSLLLMPSYTMS